MIKPINVAVIVSTARWNGMWQAAGSAAVFYDHVTTFDREIELIWTRKWSGISILYLITRYAGDALFIHASASRWASGYALEQICPSTFIVQAWLSQISVLAMNGIMVRRVICMYSEDKRVAWGLLLSLGALATYWTAINALTIIKSAVVTIQATYTIETCRPIMAAAPKLWYSAFIFVVFAFEILVFALSLNSGIRFVRDKRRTRRDQNRVGMLGHMWNTRRDLASVLVRDSILFPFVNMTFALLSILILTSKLPPISALSLRTVTAASVPIIGCRLLLNLRDAYYKPFEEEYDQSQYQDTSFIVPGLSSGSASRVSTARQSINPAS